MLGCPNMPRARLTPDDGGAEAAGRVGSDGIGVLFTAQQGCGAAVGPLTGEQVKQVSVSCAAMSQAYSSQRNTAAAPLSPPYRSRNDNRFSSDGLGVATLTVS